MDVKMNNQHYLRSTYITNQHLLRHIMLPYTFILWISNSAYRWSRYFCIFLFRWMVEKSIAYGFEGYVALMDLWCAFPVFFSGHSVIVSICCWLLMSIQCVFYEPSENRDLEVHFYMNKDISTILYLNIAFLKLVLILKRVFRLSYIWHLSLGLTCVIRQMMRMMRMKGVFRKLCWRRHSTDQIHWTEIVRGPVFLCDLFVLEAARES